MDLDGGGLNNLTRRPATDERRPTPFGPGRICYDSARGRPEDIFCLTLADGAEQALVTSPARDVHPVVGPARFEFGPALFFRSERDGNSEVYRWEYYPEAAAERRVTTDPAYDGFASGGRDEYSVLLQSNRGGRDGVYLIDYYTSAEPRPLTDGQASYISPRFTPDFRGVVLAGDGGGDFDVYVMDRLP
jgi:Tol biopolymer transport system component